MAPEVLPVALVLVACSACSPASPQVHEAQGSPPAATGQEPPLDDGQIAEIAEAIDVQQTETARLGASRASDPGVRAFAQEVLAEHEQEHRAEHRLLREQHTEVQPSVLTGRFEAATRDDRGWFTNENGASFDRDFLASEAKEQARQLDWLDHIMVPAARDPALRTELLRRRAVAARLLGEAKNLGARFPAPP